MITYLIFEDAALGAFADERSDGPTYVEYPSSPRVGVDEQRQMRGGPTHLTHATGHVGRHQEP